MSSLSSNSRNPPRFPPGVPFPIASPRFSYETVYYGGFREKSGENKIKLKLKLKFRKLEINCYKVVHKHSKRKGETKRKKKVIHLLGRSSDLGCPTWAETLSISHSTKQYYLLVTEYSQLNRGYFTVRSSKNSTQKSITKTMTRWSRARQSSSSRRVNRRSTGQSGFWKAAMKPINTPYLSFRTLCSGLPNDARDGIVWVSGTMMGTASTPSEPIHGTYLFTSSAVTPPSIWYGEVP